MTKSNDFFGVTVDPLVEIDKDDDKRLTKSITLIDHLKSIFDVPYNPEYYEKLSEQERKTFTPYMIHRFISSYDAFETGVLVANQGQMATDALPKGSVYKFYHQFFGGIGWNWKFFKYFKTQENIKYQPDLLLLIANHFRISKKESFDYLELLYNMEDGKEKIADIIRMYAYTEKEIKKLMKRDVEKK